MELVKEYTKKQIKVGSVVKVILSAKKLTEVKSGNRFFIKKFE